MIVIIVLSIPNNSTDRSILPVIMTGVIPMARNDMIVICLRRFEKFLVERKIPPVKEPKSNQIMIRAKMIVYALISILIFLILSIKLNCFINYTYNFF